MQTQVERWLIRAEPVIEAIFTSLFRDVGALPADVRGPLVEAGVGSLIRSLRAGELDEPAVQALAASLTRADAPFGAALLVLAPRLAARVRAYIRADLADEPELQAEVLQRVNALIPQVRVLIAAGQVAQIRAVLDQVGDSGSG